MKLMTDDIRARLIEQYVTMEKLRKMHPEVAIDSLPVVKFFISGTGITWLMAWAAPHDPDLMWGVCDFGDGYPKIGCVRVSELESARGRTGIPIERDPHFVPTKTLWTYYAEGAANDAVRA